MLEIKIPGFGEVRLEHLVADFTGTLSLDGTLLIGVREKLQAASRLLAVHVVTSDTFGSARKELEGLECTVVVIAGADADIQKESYVQKLGADQVLAIGNGNNDRRMFKVARIGIAVIGGEGCAGDAVMSADIIVTNIFDAFNLLLYPKRCIATLRF